MDNKTLENEIIINEGEMNELVTSMKEKLDSVYVPIDDKCCIYKVPEFILKGHERFYQPKVISIGPVFYKDPKLETMQEIKWIFLNDFLKHPNNACPNLDPYIEFLRGKESEIRSFYEHEIRLSSNEFVEMIVLDAAFLIQFFMMVHCASTDSTLRFFLPVIKNKHLAILNNLEEDLFRLENQIPYFVVKGIYGIAFGNIYGPIPFINATLTYICAAGIGIPGKKAIKSIIDDNKITDETRILHLVDLRQMCCCLSLSTLSLNHSDTNNPTSSVSYINNSKVVSSVCPSSLCNWLCHPRHLNKKTDDGLNFTAKQLKDAGVTFVAAETDNPLDILFANRKLHISKLDIFDETEAYLRNLTYFESCHYPHNYYFIDYIIFLDQLIDTVEDVQVLFKNKIFINRLGSDEDVVDLFNNISKNMPSSYKLYSSVSYDLNCYASTRRNQWMAILRTRYFNHPWAIISVIAAFILFALTIAQTTAAFIYK